jgi:AraC-type DNA-binding domain-containing proteins
MFDGAAVSRTCTATSREAAMPALPDGGRRRLSSEGAKRHGSGLAAWQVRRVTEYMLANLDRPISLSELAQLVGLSRFHFCTAFRLATARTPGSWLTDQRICRAVALLEERKLSITEIALEVGYETPSSFTARFHQRMGVTPSEYRRSFQEWRQ